jgi:hypothetical protein
MRDMDDKAGTELGTGTGTMIFHNQKFENPAYCSRTPLRWAMMLLQLTIGLQLQLRKGIAIPTFL